MIFPLWRRIIPGTTARQQAYRPLAFTANIRSHSASVISVKSFCWAMPALLTKRSICPHRSTTACTWASISATEETSPQKGTASRPSRRSRSHRARARSGWRWQPTATRQPSRASSRAAAAPMPRLPPVTIAVLLAVSILHPPYIGS